MPERLQWRRSGVFIADFAQVNVGWFVSKEYYFKPSWHFPDQSQPWKHQNIADSEQVNAGWNGIL